MRIGLVSDLHLETREVPEITLTLQKIKNSLEEVDVILDCGDLSEDDTMRAMYLNVMGPKYLYVNGNHDFYRSQLENCCWFAEVKGIKIVGCTLWTNFERANPISMMGFPRYMRNSDYKHIRKVSKDNKVTLMDELYALHIEHLNFIREKKPDIVVTHHCPSYQCVHPAYKQYNGPGEGNDYFVSDLDDFILLNQNIKYWFSGHTHLHYDFKIGETRLVNNALGNGWERSAMDWEPRIFEIE